MFGWFFGSFRQRFGPQNESIIIVITELITAVHSLTPVGRSRPEKRMWTDHPLTQFPQWSGGRAQCSGLQQLRADTLVDHGVRSRRPPVDTLVDRGVKDRRPPEPLPNSR